MNNETKVQLVMVIEVDLMNMRSGVSWRVRNIRHTAASSMLLCCGVSDGGV